MSFMLSTSFYSGVLRHKEHEQEGVSFTSAVSVALTFCLQILICKAASELCTVFANSLSIMRVTTNGY